MEVELPDLLTDAFLKQLKTGEELQAFLRDLHKRGLEKILEGELELLDGCLDRFKGSWGGRYPDYGY